MRKLLAALFCCLLIFAGAFAEDSDWTYTQSGTAAYITGYTGTETIATIPTSINGVKILGAVPGAFADTTLKDVRLDEFAASGRFTVKGDSEYGIYGPCTAKYYQGLHSLLFYKPVEIPGSGSDWAYTVENRIARITGYLGSNALEELPTTVDGYTVEGIAPGAFRGSTLKNILFNGYVGKSLRLINYGFTIDEPNTSLNDLDAPIRQILFEYSVTKDGVIYTLDEESKTATFCGFSTNKEKWTVPSKIAGYPVTRIADYAFKHQHATTKVTLPKTVVSIGKYAFFGCTDLKTITLPNSVTEIGIGAFKDCDNLTSVTLPKKLTVIPDELFMHCESLAKITIPSTVVSIGDSAFFHTGLTTVTIPASVQTIGDYAFLTEPANKTGTLSVTVQSPSVQFGRNVFGIAGSLTDSQFGIIPLCWEHTDLQPSAVTLTCYPGSTADALSIPADSPVKVTKKHLAISKLPVTKAEKAEILTADLYAGRRDVYSITIPNGVKEIADGAFANMPYLYSVKLPASVKKIGAHAFDGCANLQTVTFGKKVEVIGDAAFRGCAALTELSLPTSMVSVGELAFAECPSLRKVTLPKNITKIGKEIFRLTHDIERDLTVTCTKGSTAALWMMGNYPDIKLKVK